MKGKRFAYTAALWWLLCCAGLGILLLSSGTVTERYSAAENRTLAGQPSLTAGAVTDGSFFSGFDAWISDAFFGRDALISLTDRVTSVFDVRSEEDRLLEEEAETDQLLRDDAGENMPEISRTVWDLLIPSARAEEHEPLPADAKYALTIFEPEGTSTNVYSYTAVQVTDFAGTLNTLRGLLGEDGEVHYLQVPVSSIAHRLQPKNKNRVLTWDSTLQDALQTQVDQGVYIHNAPRILNDALVRRERCFFWTDHHWTDLGAWYCASAIMESRGYPALAYDEYDYREHPVTNAANREDRLHLMVPLLPTHSYVMKHLTEAEQIDFMNYNYHTYIAYINNTRTPWRIFTGGFGSSRKALLIADSFGNAFLPYLLPYYGEVHMTDLRKSYFDTAEAGGTFRELLSYYNIDDIYIVYSTSNGIPSANAMQVLPAEIAK